MANLKAFELSEEQSAKGSDWRVGRAVTQKTAMKMRPQILPFLQRSMEPVLQHMLSLLGLRAGRLPTAVVGQGSKLRGVKNERETSFDYGVSYGACKETLDPTSSCRKSTCVHCCSSAQLGLARLKVFFRNPPDFASRLRLEQ